MADRELLQTLDQDEYDIEYETFSNNFAKMIQWEENEWNKDLECKNDYEYIVKNLRYWNGVLKPAYNELTLMLSVYDSGRMKPIKEKQWIDFLKCIKALEFFQNFYYVRNNNIIGLQFYSVEGKKLVEENLNMFRQGFVINMEWYDANKITLIRAHWLPKGFYIKELREYFEQYIDILTVEYEAKQDSDGTYPANIILFKGILRCGNVELIPHLDFFKDLQMLIVVAGRRPMCLRCEHIGHKASSCDKIFCGECKILHNKDYVCTRKINKKETYAAKLRDFRNSKLQNQFWPSINEEGGNVKKAVSSKLDPSKKRDAVNEEDENKKSCVEDQNFYVKKSVVKKSDGMAQFSTVSSQDKITAKEIIDEGGGGSPGYADNLQSSDSDSRMDVQVSSSKRKLDVTNETKLNSEKHGEKKTFTYSLKKSSVDLRSVTSNNLFDALADEHKDVFSDH